MPLLLPQRKVDEDFLSGGQRQLCYGRGSVTERAPLPEHHRRINLQAGWSYKPDELTSRTLKPGYLTPSHTNSVGTVTYTVSIPRLYNHYGVHHLHSLLDFDRVVVLGEGNVVEYDGLNALLGSITVYLLSYTEGE
jgi:hypothetical protein